MLLGLWWDYDLGKLFLCPFPRQKEALPPAQVPSSSSRFLGPETELSELPVFKRLSVNSVSGS
jgi:hypothetical protein